jgi:hypothetical protein
VNAVFNSVIKVVPAEVEKEECMEAKELLDPIS